MAINPLGWRDEPGDLEQRPFTRRRSGARRQAAALQAGASSEGSGGDADLPVVRLPVFSELRPPHSSLCLHVHLSSSECLS